MNNIIKEDLQEILKYDLPWNEFENKVILISGANGMLPSYMVKTLLLLKNVQVIGLVRNLDKAKEKFKNYNNLRLINIDINKKIKIDGPVDFIIHAASQASPKYYKLDPVGTLSTNILGTFNLLELAREKKVKSFLFFSTGEVYGETNIFPTNEKSYGLIDPTDVRSCYAESKRMGENMCVSWFYQYQVPIKIVRPFHTFGPGLSLDDGRVFADFVNNIIQKKDIELKSDGSARRSFCYIVDATIGFFLILLKGQDGEAYNVGNDINEFSIYELAQIATNLFPELNLSVIRKEKADLYLQSPISRNCPDISKIKKLGWIPKYSITDSFYRTIQSFR